MDTLTAILKKLGPGLLFASASIGTSHLVLSTRAGAHHGMIYFWVLAVALFLKYPFFEFGARYAATTKQNLLHAYRQQGYWAILVLSLVICVTMFTVPAAVAAVTAGLLSLILHLDSGSMPSLVFLCIFLSAGLLMLGGFSALNRLVKLISVLLFSAISICFIAMLFNGPVHPSKPVEITQLIEGSGLILLVSLVGWMPTGLEASVIHSIWVVKNSERPDQSRELKDVLFDFNFGYIFTALVAFMFLLVGAYSIYGSEQLLDGNSIQFTAALISIFTEVLGPWSRWMFALAAFGTIYGTLIVVLDAFSRTFIECGKQLSGRSITVGKKEYVIALSIVSSGAFILFLFLSKGMIHMLELATIISFVCAPVIAFVNFRAILFLEKSGNTVLPMWLKFLSWAGLIFLSVFAIYYVYTQLFS